MSCTVMYQPYAMTSYSNCDRPAPEKKSFRFPYVPSPPDSLHSDGSSYSSPGPSSGGTTSSSASQQNNNTSHSHRRPLTPSCGSTGVSSLSLSSQSSAPATITSASQLQHNVRSPPSAHHNQNTSSTHSNNSSSSRHLSHTLGTGNATPSHQRSSVPSASATSTSQSHLILGGDENETPVGSGSSSEPGGSRAQYLSANCVVYENYRGDTARVVEEHFSRALSAPYSNDKASKISPMAQRNFPPSFFNSNYQPSKPLVSYGASEYYGAAVDYGPSLSGLTHHQTDPWHYPMSSHQGYHHRPTDLSYPPMPSTSRFNAAQYGMLLAGAAATSSAASRFSAMPGSSQCGVGVKGDGPSAWPSGRYHHPHDSLSELHLADYSAAAAAHYSNMTAGLETTVGQESSSKDLYWF